jgi:TolA-binding protein
MFFVVRWLLVCLIPACLACLLTLVAVAAPAAGVADKEGIHKRTAVDVKAIERRFTQPVTPAAAPKTGGPTVSGDEFVANRTDKKKRINEALIAKMRQLIATTADDDPQKPDFLFRAGELYAEAERHYFNQARGLDQKLFEAPAARKPALRAEQQRFEAEQQRWMLEAVKSYMAATRHPKYERMDEVLFRLAALLTAAKKEDQAREFFLRLIKDYPASKYIPDAYLAFAEHHFDKGDMPAALRFYDKVAQFPKSSLYPYAVYKQGWCHINMTDYRQALETFVAVVRLTKERKPDPQLVILAKEAKKDIVKAYSHVGGPDRAWEFFQRTGGEYAPKMMDLLAELYWDEGKAPESTRIYKKIIAENMRSPRVCEWQGKVLRNTLSAAGKPEQAQELERLGAVFETLPANQKTAAASECRNSFHDAARELAIIWHREAMKTQVRETFALADRAYQQFLAAFPADKDVYEMRFYAGEVLWALKRWKDAAEQYTKVVDANPRGKYLREAAFAAVLAWKNALVLSDQVQQEAIADRLRARGEGEKLAPRPIPDSQQKMLAAFQSFRRHVPGAPELPVIIYQEGYIYYDHNRFDEAQTRFREVVDRYPTHELAIYAANLYVDSLNAQGKTAEVLASARKFLDTPALAKDATFATQMVSIISDGYEVEAHRYSKRGDNKECGRSFLAAADALPDHKKHAERLWNAGQCFQNAGLIGQAIKAWTALDTAHPTDGLAKRAQYRIGAGHQQIAYYSAAADFYEKFAKKFPGEPEARRALANATVFREGLGHYNEALADMDAYIGFYGGRDPAGAAGVYFQKGEVYEQQGKLEALRDHLASYLDRWGKHGGVDRQMQAHFRLGEIGWKASCARPSADGACLHVERMTATRSRRVIEAANRRLGTARRTQCGPATKSKITVFDRNRREASGAQEHFRAAIKLWQSDAANFITGRDADARKALAAYAAAGAAFHLAEQHYEDLLRIKFPHSLDFSQPSPRDSARRRAAAQKKLDDSRKRFAAYLDDKAKALDTARARYLEVFKLRQAQWTIAAAARVGQLYQDFAGQLYTAEIPKDLPDVDAWGNHPRDEYCRRLEEEADKVEAKAVEALRSCLTAATNESWYNHWSRLCEQELSQLQPGQFPVASEIKPEPVFVPTVLLAAPLISNIGE